jgi:hypothetical protein
MIDHYYQQHQELVHVIQNGCFLWEVRSWSLSPRRPRWMKVPDPEVRSNTGVRPDLRIWIACSHRADLHVRCMSVSHAGSSMRNRPRPLMAKCNLHCLSTSSSWYPLYRKLDRPFKEEGLDGKRRIQPLLGIEPRSYEYPCSLQVALKRVVNRSVCRNQWRRAAYRAFQTG